jgi:hypothetical protein
MCMLPAVQIVFAGVFLLTKASAPAHPQSQPASPLAAAELSHAKVAYLHSSMDGADEAPERGSEGSIGTATDTQADGGINGLMAAPVPGETLAAVRVGQCSV